MKHGKPVLQSIRLLDQVRERIRYLHYSLSTEKVYLYWVRFFVRNPGSGLNTVSLTTLISNKSTTYDDVLVGMGT